MKYSIALILAITFAPYAEAKQCFDTTKTSKLPPFNNLGSFNKDGTAYISNTMGMMGSMDYENSVQEKLIVHDLKNNKTHEFPKKLNEFAMWTPDGNISFMEMSGEGYTENISAENYLKMLKKAKYSKLDFKTGKRKAINGDMILPDGSEVKIEKVTKVGKEIIVFTKDNRGQIKELSQTLDESTIHYDYMKMINVTHKDGVLMMKKNNKEVFSAKVALAPKEKASEQDERFDSSMFQKNHLNAYISLEANFLVFKNNTDNKTTDKYLLVDLNKKTQLSVDLPKDAQLQPVPKKENLVFVKKLNEKDNELSVLDLKTGKITKTAGGNLYNPTLEDNGNVCGLKYPVNAAPYGGGLFPGMGMMPGMNFNRQTSLSAERTSDNSIKYECISKDGKKISSIKVTDTPNMVTALGNNKFIITNESGTQLAIPQETCVEKLEFITCDCEVPKTSLIETNALLNINLKLACQEEFSPDLWLSLTLRPIKTLDEKSGHLWLKKFSKPGGFSANDLDVFSTLIEGKLYNQYPGEFKAALASILNNSAPLYKDIIKKYPELKKISSEVSNDCLTKTELNEINSTKRNFVKTEKESIQNLTEENLVNLIDLTKNILTNEEKDNLADQLGDLAVEKMSMDPILKDAFPSKVHKFSYNHIKKMLDLPHKDLTDITLLRNNGMVNFVQLGVQPFEGSKPTVGGFHLKLLSSKPDSQFLNKSSTEAFNWNYGGKKYSAKIDVKNEVSSSDITPPSLAPNYKEMKKDKAFRGMIVAGTNLGKSTTDMVVRHYIQYYSDQGFEFEEPADVTDLPGLLKARVSGDEPAHYLVKEAHSDGDEKNLFRINNNGKVLTGTKIVDGKKEIVEIVYPGEDNSSTLLSNNKFGDWMKAREAKKGAELLYVNSSCWSASKATYEIAAANSAKLVNIPTTTSMTTFTNDENNVMYAAIDGIRKEKSYADIRKDMEKDPEYKKKINNIMIFPDEPLYTTVIREKIKVPLTVDTNITLHDKSGPVPYSIEQ